MSLLFIQNIFLKITCSKYIWLVIFSQHKHKIHDYPHVPPLATTTVSLWAWDSCISFNLNTHLPVYSSTVLGFPGCVAFKWALLFSSLPHSEDLHTHRERVQVHQLELASTYCSTMNLTWWRRGGRDVAFSCWGLESATVRTQPLCSVLPIGAGIYLCKWMGGGGLWC